MIYHNRHLLGLSAQIVAAHAGNNHVGSEALPDMIRSIYTALADLDAAGLHIPVLVAERNAGEDTTRSGDQAHTAYVHPDYGQTVFADHLICMEDGLTMKMLKRHLLTVHGMTPDEYRAKWGLPSDSPMVAAEYAKLRSSLALQSGLGLKPEDRPTKRRRIRKV